MQIKPVPPNPKLDSLVKWAREHIAAMSPAERAAMHEAQKRNYMRAEACFGSDADEAAYSRAIELGDESAIARLEAEAAARIAAVNAYLAQREQTDG